MTGKGRGKIDTPERGKCCRSVEGRGYVFVMISAGTSRIVFEYHFHAEKRDCHPPPREFSTTNAVLFALNSRVYLLPINMLI